MSGNLLKAPRILWLTMFLLPLTVLYNLILSIKPQTLLSVLFFHSNISVDTATWIIWMNTHKITFNTEQMLLSKFFRRNISWIKKKNIYIYIYVCVCVCVCVCVFDCFLSIVSLIWLKTNLLQSFFAKSNIQIIIFLLFAGHFKVLLVFKWPGKKTKRLASKCSDLVVEWKIFK